MSSFDEASYTAGYEAGIKGEAIPSRPELDVDSVAHGYTAGESIYLAAACVEA